MNCLVLGGAGFLGSHLCESLLSLGHRVRVFERQGFSRRNIAPMIDRVEIREGEFDATADAGSLVKDMDFVFHLVSTTLPASSNKDPIYDVASNVLPTLRLLQAVNPARLRKFIFFSSGGTVYGVPERVPIDEKHPTNPTSSYGIHKLAIEKYLGLYQHLYGLKPAILRISNAYGERQSPTSGQGIVAAVLFNALRGEPIEIWGDGSVVRDYIHVADVVAAAVACMEYNGPETVFNVGSGVGSSVLDVIHFAEEAVGRRMEVRYLPGRGLDVPVSVLATSRVQAELGWRPSVMLRDGVRRTLAYYRDVEALGQEGRQGA